MHPELHRYLDGEISRSSLSPAAAAELAEWEPLESAVAHRRAERAPRGLVGDVMRALPPVHAPSAGTSGWQRVVSWLMTPRPLRIAPMAPLMATAAIAAVMLFMPRSESTGVVPTVRDVSTRMVAAPAVAVTPVVYVQFALTAKDAQSVAVAGDFNGWSTDAGVLRDADGDGVWVGLVPVTPGMHKYMFVINESEWVTDPRAEAYVDDGFGMRNAVIGVRDPAAGRTI